MSHKAAIQALSRATASSQVSVRKGSTSEATWSSTEFGLCETSALNLLLIKAALGPGYMGISTLEACSIRIFVLR